MAVIMLAFMQNMLADRRVNVGIIVGSVAVFGCAGSTVPGDDTDHGNDGAAGAE